MKINKRLILSFVAPFMILMCLIGFIFRHKTKKMFYFPIGFMGVAIILERGVSRKLSRENILRKINSYKKINK